MIGLNLAAWNLWCSYRKSIKKPYKTEFAIERAQKKLASFGEYQMQVVEHCREREWTGIFPLPKSVMAEIKKREREQANCEIEWRELRARAEKVGFREPLKDEDAPTYKMLLARAEDQDYWNRRKGPTPISQLLKGAM